MPNLVIALRTAYIVVILELITIAYIRFKFMKSSPGRTIVLAIIGGGIVFMIGILLGRLGVD